MFRILIVICNIIRGLKAQMLVILFGLCIGVAIISITPVQSEKYILNTQSQNIATAKTKISILGNIDEISENTYFKQIILKDVAIDGTTIVSKVKVIIENGDTEHLKDIHISLNDKISVIGELEEIEVQMNPSDFDNEKYLLSENILCQIKASEIKLLESKDTLMETANSLINKQIVRIFNNRDFGIINALILGDDSKLDVHTDEMYMLAGIGHILCISGFHVGLIMALTLSCMSKLGIGYYTRYIIALLVIWFYGGFTSFATSTVRASIMITVFIGSRVLIEEEDNLNSLAVASIIILIISPYQLFMPGFQLSFLAVLGVTLASQIIMKLKVDNKFKKWHATFIPWIMIQLATLIPLVYHFYEVPFISSLLNFVTIPIFSMILIVGWISIGISFISINIAVIIGNVICLILNTINIIVEKVLELPYSTILIGRPSTIQMCIYIVSILIFIYGLGGYFKSLLKYQASILMVVIALMVIRTMPSSLNISLLYVGQGDGTVIITPNDKVIVIDGGNKGKGKVVSNYLKFKGKKKIDVMILSHSDADHISGLSELLEIPIKVNQVIISRYDESKALNQFLDKCKDKNIRVNSMSRGDSITLGETKIDILAPKLNYNEGNTNDNSLVCHIKYKEFTALFTGDKSIGNEELFYNNINNLSVLKVSHHGSKTGTSKALILKTNPLYAMISCGKNNSYGHPHKEVINILDKYNVAYNKTSSSGAIIIETNGEAMNISKHREE